MWAIIGFIFFVGMVFFIVKAARAKKKKEGHLKKWVLYSVGFFILAMVSYNLDPSIRQQQAEEQKKATQQEASIKEKADKETHQKVMDEIEKANAKVNVQAQAQKDKEESATLGKDTLAALNDFPKFIEEYKNLGSNKTIVWDNQVYGKKVTWKGTVVDHGTSELFVYGLDDYKGESWQQLGDEKKLYYSFVAKYAESKQFEGLKRGDIVTIEGDLKSRGDFDLNYHWKIYNAVLKSKQ